MRLMKMMLLTELKEKIEQLETERTHLANEIKKLQIEADKKALDLQKEIGCLKEEADSLRELLATV
jgi:uncharacterized protein (UPF0335 family)